MKAIKELSEKVEEQQLANLLEMKKIEDQDQEPIEEKMQPIPSSFSVSVAAEIPPKLTSPPPPSFPLQDLMVKTTPISPLPPVSLYSIIFQPFKNEAKPLVPNNADYFTSFSAPPSNNSLSSLAFPSTGGLPAIQPIKSGTTSNKGGKRADLDIFDPFS